MSVYCTIQGEINYEKQEDFNAAVSLLQEALFMDAEGFFLTECGERLSGYPNIQPLSRFVEIPCSLYRNLGYILDRLVQNANADVIWTTTDGDFQGGVISQGQETLYDLTKWAKENIDPDEATPPDITEGDGQSYCDWQGEVERAFFEEFS